MAGSFHNPRLATHAAERMRAKCLLAENFISEPLLEDNTGVVVLGGGTATINRGATLAGGARIDFPAVPSTGSMSVVVQFTHGGDTGSLLYSAFWDGFAISIENTPYWRIKLQHYNGSGHDFFYYVVDLVPGTEYTLTYIIDQGTGFHTIHLNDLAPGTAATPVTGPIGVGNPLRVAWTGMDFTINKLRVFDAVLTADDHADYHNGTDKEQATEKLGTWRCDSVGDDAVGNVIWENSKVAKDITKGDGTTASTFPTFDTDKYLFDGATDYISTVPTLPAVFTVSAAVSTVAAPYPVIRQETDETLLTELKTAGGYSGYLHNLIIFQSELTALQLKHTEYLQRYWTTRGMAYGALHRLVIDGSGQVVLYPRSSLNNHGLAAGVIALYDLDDGDVNGYTFPNAGSVIILPDASGARTDALSISVHGFFDTSGTAGHLVHKGSNYEFKTNGNQLDLNGSTIAHTFDDNVHLAVVARDGFKPRFFVDGEYIGEGTSTVTLDDTDTADVSIGNINGGTSPTPYEIAQVSICNETLTDDEVRMLYCDSARASGAAFHDYRFEALEGDNGIDNLANWATINGTRVYAHLVYEGADAATTFPPVVGTDTLVLTGAGDLPSTSQPAYGNGTRDIGVAGERGQYYLGSSNGTLGTKDAVFELIIRTGEPTYANAIVGQDDMTDGWRFRQYSGGYVRLYFNQGGTLVFLNARVSILGEHAHVVGVLHRAGNGVVFTNAVIGTSKSLAGVTGDTSVVAPLTILGASALPTTDCSIVRFSMWQSQAWLSTHNISDWVSERFNMWCGLYPDFAIGSPLPTSTTLEETFIEQNNSGVISHYRINDGVAPIGSILRGTLFEGLLLVPSVTNVLSYAFDFNSWAKYRTAINTATGIPSPFKGFDYQGFVADINNSYHRVYAGSTLAAGDATFQITQKAGSLDWSFLEHQNAAAAVQGVYVNISTGAIGSYEGAGSSIQGVTSKALGDGNYTFSLKVTADAGTNNVFIYPADSNGDRNIQGDASTIQMYLAGAQVEAGGVVNPVVFTNGATATRAADEIIYKLDDGNHKPGEGKVECDVLLSAGKPTVSNAFLNIWDGTSNNTIALAVDTATGAVNAIVIDGGVPQVIGAGTINVSDSLAHSIRVEYETNSFKVYIDDVEDISDLACTIPTGLTEAVLAGDAGLMWLRNLKINGLNA